MKTGVSLYTDRLITVTFSGDVTSHCMDACCHATRHVVEHVKMPNSTAFTGGLDIYYVGQRSNASSDKYSLSQATAFQRMEKCPSQAILLNFVIKL